MQGESPCPFSPDNLGSNKPKENDMKISNKWHSFTLNYSNLTEAQIAKIEKALIETAEQLKDDEDIPFEYGGGSNIVTTDSGEF
jgi:hypothetical protein